MAAQIWPVLQWTLLSVKDWKYLFQAVSGKNVLYQGMQGSTEILQYACQKSLALIADFCIDGALEEWSKVLEALTCQHCHLDDAGNLDNQA